MPIRILASSTAQTRVAAKLIAASTKPAVRACFRAALRSPITTATSARRCVRRMLASAPLHAAQCFTCDSCRSKTSALLARAGSARATSPAPSRLQGAPSPLVYRSIHLWKAATIPSEAVGSPVGVPLRVQEDVVVFENFVRAQVRPPQRLLRERVSEDPLERYGQLGDLKYDADHQAAAARLQRHRVDDVPIRVRVGPTVGLGDDQMGSAEGEAALPRGRPSSCREARYIKVVQLIETDRGSLRTLRDSLGGGRGRCAGSMTFSHNVLQSCAEAGVRGEVESVYATPSLSSSSTIAGPSSPTGGDVKAPSKRAPAHAHMMPCRSTQGSTITAARRALNAVPSSCCGTRTHLPAPSNDQPWYGHSRQPFVTRPSLRGARRWEQRSRVTRHTPPSAWSPPLPTSPLASPLPLSLPSHQTTSGVPSSWIAFGSVLLV
eukprot:scaffold78503_cov63-Phaeocystis_antarctica.AAC.6